MIDETEFDKVCQDCADYIKFIYSKICFKPEKLNVRFTIGDFVHFIIEGDEADDGILIGRAGATVQSLRLFVHAFSKTNMEGRPCIVEVRDHRGSKYNPLSGDVHSRRTKRRR